jgi:plasmid stabilization system protein ParE
MRIKWTKNAVADLDRLHAFLAQVDGDAAAKAIQALVTAPERLLGFPRLGANVEGFENRDVRKIIVGRYEMRYEVAVDQIIILRIWHGREQRT